MTASYEFLPLGDVQPRGWIGEQLNRQADGFVGHLDELSSEVGGEIFVNRNASAESTVGWWNGESEGNWIDGLTRLAGVVELPAVKEKVSRYMDRVLTSQASDGYLGVYPDAARKAGFCVGDLWTQSRLLLAMLAHHQLTRRVDVLEAAVRAARETATTYERLGWATFWDPADSQNDGARAHGLMIIEPMLQLHELTGERVFLDTAVSCFDAYSGAVADWGVSDCQLGRLADPNVPFASHGVHTCEALRLPWLLYRATGLEVYRTAALVGYRKMEACLGVGGGGRDVGGVPLPGAGHEACTLTELLLSLHTAIAVSGDLQYADLAEQLLFNAAQGAVSTDGRSMAYLSADNQYEATGHRGWQWRYSPVHDVVCCAPNLGRLLPGHVSRMVVRTADAGLAVIFYGPSETNCQLTPEVRATITQETAYPFEDEVRIRVRTSRAHRFPLHLRVPSWAVSADVSGSGSTDVRRDGRTMVIDREWHDDEIVLSLDCVVRLVDSVDGGVAVARGPLLFALPIDSRGTPVKDYALPGFQDFEYVPSETARWDFTLQVDRADPARTFQTVRPEPNGSFPWDYPPLVLRTVALDPKWTQTTVAPSASEVELVPYGSSILRRSVFPHVNREGLPILGPASA